MTSEQPGPASAAFARRFFQAVSAIGALLLLFAAWHFQLSMGGRALVWYAVGLCIIAVGILVARLPVAIQLGLALLSLTTAIMLLATEWGLERYSKVEFLNSQKQVEAATGIKFDGRSIPAVVRDLRSAGTPAVPSIVPKVMRQYTAADATPATAFRAPFFPLAGVSNRVTVQLCNEDGRYPIYTSDRHGFNNPAAVWDSTPAEIVFIGDSYTHGYCVPADSALPDLVRAAHPRTFNLGTGGSGPLSELATLREYGVELGPKLIIWVYCENDLRDLAEERIHPTLIKYLDSSYAQHLFGAQAGVDSALLPWIDRVYRDGSAPTLAPDEGLRELVTFNSLRKLIWPPIAVRGSVDETSQIPLLKEILTEAQRTISAHGSRMLFVYIPAWERYYAPETIGDDRPRKMVLETVRSLEIPLLDLALIVESAPQRDLLFGRRNLRSAHFSSAGYVLSAKAILGVIDSAGMLASARP